jgi:hypothetical protein
MVPNDWKNGIQSETCRGDSEMPASPVGKLDEPGWDSCRHRNDRYFLFICLFVTHTRIQPLQNTQTNWQLCG